MAKKYEFTGEVNAQGLKRIRALRDIPRHGVKILDEGGWLASENNLDHKGDCWVADEAAVHELAVLRGDAIATDGANIYGEAIVHGYTRVSGYATVYGQSRIYGFACVRGWAVVRGNASIQEHTIVSGEAIVRGHAVVGGRSVINGSADVAGVSYVYNAILSSGMHGHTLESAINQEILESDSALARELLRQIKHV